MLDYNRFILSNGLRVIHHYDNSSSQVVLNVLYNVGARDESADKTGFAHFFEHLMFGGSLHIPEYDKAVEMAGGTNNAFTNNDYTNYYIGVPAENAETAFWLESDRMLQLDFSQKSLDVQRGVVIEEFRQRCFNAPFGKLWHHLRELLYTKHPYRWPTIGKEIKHIEEATLADVEVFYYRHYHPANAILCVAGKISLDETKHLCSKWFESIVRSGPVNENSYDAEPEVINRRFLSEKDLSPDPAVFMAWRCPGFSENESRMAEIFAEMLGGTETSPLYTKLVKNSGKFNAAESFCMRGLDDSIFMVYGILNEGVSHEEGEQLLMQVMQEYMQPGAFKPEIFKGVQNRAKASMLYERVSIFNRAQKFCFYELTGDVSEIEKEADRYLEFSEFDALTFSAATFRSNNASVIYYSPLS